MVLYISEIRVFEIRFQFNYQSIPLYNPPPPVLLCYWVNLTNPAKQMSQSDFISKSLILFFLLSK